MKHIKRNNKGIPDPYEDIVRLEQLDPYEALIKSKSFLRKKIKLLNNINYCNCLKFKN